VSEYLPVLLYHGVLSGPAQDTARWPGAAAYAITRDLFQNHLEEIQAVNLHTVTDPFDLEGGEPRRLGHIALTFDDALDSHYHIVFPLLELVGMKGVFFVSASDVDKRGRMTWSQLREIVVQGHVVGSHGLTHTLLPEVDQLRLMAELEGSRKLLEDRLDRPVDFLALPGGRYDHRIILGAFEAGYRGVFSSDFGLNHLPLIFGRPIRRINVTSRTGTDGLRAILAADPAQLAWGRGLDLVRRTARVVLSEKLYQWLWYRARSAHQE